MRKTEWPENDSKQTQMKLLVSHPTGNANVRAVLAAFERNNILARYFTTISASPNSPIIKFLPKSIRKEVLRRSYSIDNSLIETYPVKELGRILLPKIGLKKLTRHEFGAFSVDAVYRSFDHRVSKHLESVSKRHHLDAVYAYEDGALETFRKAKSLGIKCIYDLPIAYWACGRELMRAEAERLPEWACTMGGSIKDSDLKLKRKEEEMDLADVVVGPGKFVLDSIPEKSKIKHLIQSPFGSPESLNNLPNHRGLSGKLKVLFVGSMGQRKGLGDLFQAVKLLDQDKIELIVLGSLLQPLEFYKSIYPNFKHISNRPHSEVLEIMRSCDVFCLPSIVEGRALVMQEAMSQGLPIIITPNTGGEDLVIHEKTGFLVPIRSPEEIAEKLNWFLENRNSLPHMSRAAKEHATNYSWAAYGERIAKDLINLESTSR